MITRSKQTSNIQGKNHFSNHIFISSLHYYFVFAIHFFGNLLFGLYRYEKSYFLGPSIVLPKLDYVSMVFDRESDSSIEADAAAMKYLSDEQLTKLRKLQLTPTKKGHPGLDCLLPNTPPTPNLKHMSFASRKYLQRYNLFEGAEANTVPAPADARDSLPTRSKHGEASGTCSYDSREQEAAAVEQKRQCNVRRSLDSSNKDRVLEDIEHLRGLPKLV